MYLTLQTTRLAQSIAWRYSKPQFLYALLWVSSPVAGGRASAENSTSYQEYFYFYSAATSRTRQQMFCLWRHIPRKHYVRIKELRGQTTTNPGQPRWLGLQRFAGPKLPASSFTVCAINAVVISQLFVILSSASKLFFAFWSADRGPNNEQEMHEILGATINKQIVRTPVLSQPLVVLWSAGKEGNKET